VEKPSREELKSVPRMNIIDVKIRSFGYSIGGDEEKCLPSFSLQVIQ
jgi:hypothetical protein